MRNKDRGARGQNDQRTRQYALLPEAIHAHLLMLLLTANRVESKSSAPMYHFDSMTRNGVLELEDNGLFANGVKTP